MRASVAHRSGEKAVSLGFCVPNLGVDLKTVLRAGLLVENHFSRERPPIISHR